MGGHLGSSGDDDDDDTPSALLGPLLEEWRHVLVKHVLERLDPKDCALVAQVGKPWLKVVVANKLPRAGKAGSLKLKVVNFVESVEMMEWAKANGCPWNSRNVAHKSPRAGTWMC